MIPTRTARQPRNGARAVADALAAPRLPEAARQLLLGALIVLGALVLSLRTGHAQTTVSHGISTFGELKYGPDFDHLDYVNPEAPKGGEIVIANQSGSFDSFNPYARKGVAAAMASEPVERLMTGTDDTIGENYCLLCESLEYPEDRAWVIFTLRPEAKFSDGTPVRASDVVFTHNLFMEQGLPSFRAGVARIIKGVEALDERRVKFTFVEDAPMKDRIDQAGSTPVLSEAYMTANDYRLDQSNIKPILGSGPYVLDSYKINERVVYRRNPDYWGEKLPINVGRHNFDTIRIEYFADTNAAFEGFKAGAYTFRLESSAKQWATGYDFPAVDKGWVVRSELPDGAMASGQAFVFNLRRDKFDDSRVRQAIGLMFNFEWSNKTLFYGLYDRVTGFATNSYNEAKGVAKGKEREVLLEVADLLPEGELDGPVVMPPVSGPRQFDRKNARKASALLDAAGWTVGDDGIRRNAKGETLDVEFLEYSPAFDRVVNPYVDNLRKIGVNASLNRVDTAQYIDRLYAFDYDIITDHLSIGYEAGSGLEQKFGSREAANSVFNSAGLANPAVDKLIDIARAAPTREDMIAGMRALDRTLRALRFTVPQWYKDMYTVAYWDMYEHPETLPPYDLGYLDFWWFNQQKADALKAAGALR